ncbi:cell filamentation protein Fic [Marinifilum sp. N1E240]|uniref:Fic family protein n=1 Tax=Marinifilum sp. N1E240 TaxID=2608082 RepID=UPI00128D6FE0|nr:Fic family protein [Marinifilum sp. N1E240]MPQ48114.1 cell filamentation protein Fic [Marinifilum sp. N1E240]
MSNQFSQKKTVFHGRELPEEGFLIGYALIIDIIEYETNKSIPLPEILAIATEKHQRYNSNNWQIFTIRHKPNDNLISHLIFAIKYEGIDLFIIKNLFQLMGKDPVLKMINEEPTSQYTRRIWFLYEWLMNIELDVPNLKAGTYVEIVNSKFQYAGIARNSTRHRIKNNLPGIPEYCPMIRKTVKLDRFIGENLSGQIEKGLNKHDKELVRRTAAFLLLKDSKASFAIEGEYPPNLRARNWGKIIGQAGKIKLTISEIERLQDIVIGSKKLKNMGLRKEEGFIGEHDRDTFSPIPDHISAKANDLPILMKGLIDTNNLLTPINYDPVLIATTVAFGFVFIHPLSDGNGRIHRYIIHHILAETGYTKRDMIFPVSTAILDRISDYRDILESYSHPRLDLIKWEETQNHNVKVLNETIDLYRYFDLTKHAEFLYECVEETIKTIIPDELDYIRKYDLLNNYINSKVTLSDNNVDLLIKFLDQNNGRLSKKRRLNEFEELSDNELALIEEYYNEIFLTED